MSDRRSQTHFKLMCVNLPDMRVLCNETEEQRIRRYHNEFRPRVKNDPYRGQLEWVEYYKNKRAKEEKLIAGALRLAKC